MHRAVVIVVLVLVGAGGGMALTAVPGAMAVGVDAPLSSVHTDPPDLGLSECAPEVPDDYADPEENVLGWYNGTWYSEPIDITVEDGLNDTELQAVIDRTKARWEALRCLPFEEDVTVEVIDRETFQEEQGDRNVSDDERYFENAQAQALFLVGDDEDAIEVQEANRGEAVQGYYSPDESKIVLVSGSDGKIFVDESTLAHELGHALQDQHFGLGDHVANTTDETQARLGLIEGDVVFIQRVYEGHCAVGAWADDCLEPEPDDPGELANYGLYFLLFQPYADGPSYAQHLYEEAGWDGLNAAYDEYPTSAKEIMYPELYPAFEPRDPDLEDRSGEEWELIEPPNRQSWDRIGEPGLFVSFIQPTYETGGQVQLIDLQQDFFNYDPDGAIDSLNPFDYSHEYTDGWVGDRFKAYVQGDGDGETMDTLGFTWAIEFEDEAAASTFLEGYDELLEFRMAESTDMDGVVTIDAGDGYDGAYWIEQSGSTVTIVHGPTVDDLPAIDERITLTPTEGVLPGVSIGEVDATTMPDAQPAFTVITTIVAIAALGTVAVFYRSRQQSR